MEELIIQRNKKIQYEFYPDLIIVKKNGKVKREIKLSDVQKFFYNPKFRVKHLFTRIFVVLFARNLLRSLWSTSVCPNSFEIYLKSDNKYVVKRVVLKIKPSDYEKVKEVLRLKEVGITEDF
ncbi:MAG: hypothetical protein K2N18_00620 [Clostridia bacterium]|nr:hypothetical protein [Clostridia bacterium]